MLKLSQILSEGKSVNVSRFIKKSLFYMCQEKVNPTNPGGVYRFLKNQLFLKDEKEITMITKLYCHNFKLNVHLNNCELSGDLILPVEVGHSEHLALSHHLEIDPYFIKLIQEGIPNYLAQYWNTLEDESYFIGTYIESKNATKQKVRHIIQTEGYEYWDEDFITYYIEVDHDNALYNAENDAIESQGNYDEDEMRTDLWIDDEYDDLIEEWLYEEEELKEKIGEHKIVKFKLEKLDKEKKIIEREIETLGFSLDYDEDEDGYSEMYNIDISEMTNTLHELETVIYELLSYNEGIEREIVDLEETIKKSNEEIKEYEGDKLVDRWIDHRKEMTLQDYIDDPLNYINDSGFTISEAEEEGLIDIDVESLITDSISDMGSHLGGHDNQTYWTEFNGEKYYIFRN